MTFDEWWADCPADESARDAAHDAWDYAARQATLAERERAARIAIEAAEHHRDHCPPGCRCADGWHIACRIREGKG